MPLCLPRGVKRAFPGEDWQPEERPFKTNKRSDDVPGKADDDDDELDSLFGDGDDNNDSLFGEGDDKDGGQEEEKDEVKDPDLNDMLEKLAQELDSTSGFPTSSSRNTDTQANAPNTPADPPKRGRGRPRKNPPTEPKEKGKPGRPRKNPAAESGSASSSSTPSLPATSRKPGKGRKQVNSPLPIPRRNFVVPEYKTAPTSSGPRLRLVFTTTQEELFVDKNKFSTASRLAYLQEREGEMTVFHDEQFFPGQKSSFTPAMWQSLDHYLETSQVSVPSGVAFCEVSRQEPAFFLWFGLSVYSLATYLSFKPAKQIAMYETFVAPAVKRLDPKVIDEDAGLSARYNETRWHYKHLPGTRRFDWVGDGNVARSTAEQVGGYRHKSQESVGEIESGWRKIPGLTVQDPITLD